jgi:hypothetical protein
VTVAAEVSVVRSLAAVSEVFLGLAASLRSLEDVQKVSSLCWMRAEERLGEDHFRLGSGDGFRIEWYAEAEFVDGRVLSFSQEVAWHDGEWVVDASVRSSGADGEDVLLDLPRRFAVTAEDAVAELEGQSRLLVDRRDEAVRLFSQRA